MCSERRRSSVLDYALDCPHNWTINIFGIGHSKKNWYLLWQKYTHWLLHSLVLLLCAVCQSCTEYLLLWWTHIQYINTPAKHTAHKYSQRYNITIICMTCLENALAMGGSSTGWEHTLTTFSTAVFSINLDPCPGLPGQVMVNPARQNHAYILITTITTLMHRLYFLPVFPLGIWSRRRAKLTE